MENKRILVIGGTGYIGSEIVKLLKKQNKVTILSKIECPIEGVEFLKGNLLSREFVLKFIKSYDLIIYLAAIIRSINKKKYDENIITLSNTLDAMKLNGIKKIIYFSTQKVHIDKTGPYGNSKKDCEIMLKKSNLDYLIIRPNYVYGIDKSNDLYKLSRIIKRFRICPIIGNGKNKIQPIDKVKLAEVVVKNLNFKKNSAIDLSGDITLSLNELSLIIKNEIKGKSLILHIPLFILKLFKFIIPFDIEGYDKDMLPKFNKISCKCDLYESIHKICTLDD